MQEVSGIDLTQFKHWYSQAGTPNLTVHESYDASKKNYTLTITQQTPTTKNAAENKPLFIPIRMGY